MPMYILMKTVSWETVFAFSEIILLICGLNPNSAKQLPDHENYYSESYRHCNAP